MDSLTLMRGADITQEPLFTTIKLDEQVPYDHPLRSIKILFDQRQHGRSFGVKDDFILAP
jgi:hypothetical protein